MMHWTVLPAALFACLMTVSPVTFASDVETFDIAGMKLGMSETDIEKAAAKHGLAVDHRTPGPSFAQKIATAQGERVAGKDFQSVRGMRLVAETEEVNVDFVATREGARAFRISHMLLDRSLKPDAIGAQIQQQYGKPDVKRDKEWIWGDTQAYSVLRTSPYLEFSIRPMTRSKSMQRPVVQLTLENPAMPKQAKAAVDAEG